jgi:hypothetical protein
MPEGGKGAVSVNVDFKDVWSAVHDVADWIDSEATLSLANNVFVIPKGVQTPNELTGWNSEPGQLADTHKWTGIMSDTRIRYGVNWYYGGQYNGQGRYIGNADVHFEVLEIGRWEKFHVAAHFDSPLNVGAGVAHLAGSFAINYYEYGSLSRTLNYHFYIQGDGAGRFWEG